MALIPREKIDDVRERTNLVDIVKRHVELKRAGTGSWKGLCPFHAEKTPSFQVHEQRQFFYCFGCGEKGDVYTFLTKIEQRSFMEVLRDLAQESGVELPEKAMSPAERKAMADSESERERMLRVMELAVAFYEAQLETPAADPAREYLRKRGISEPVAKRFRIGFAPAGWDALCKYLASKQVAPALAERLGLVGIGDRGPYDFFRDRVMLPVLDRQKRTIGFSSRLLDPEAKERKYVNSPDSPLFHKKQNLYGLHAGLDAVRKSGVAVVVEGNFDVLSLHETGIEEAVAPMGTALTPEHVSLLGRVAHRVVVVFDGDEAGTRAARKSLPVFLEAGVDGRLARMPAGLDPDDFVREHGAAVFRELVDNARPMVEQFIDDLARETEPSVPGRVRALETAAAVLAKVRNLTERELYAGRLAAALGLVPGQVTRAVRAAGSGASGHARSADTVGSSAPAEPPVTRRIPVRDELEAFVLLVTRPELHQTPEADRIPELLVDGGIRHIYRTALQALRSGERADVPAWLDACPADIREAVGDAVMDGRYEGMEGVDRAWRALLARLSKSRVEAEMASVDKELRDALAHGDADKARAMQIRAIELRQTKEGLSNALSRP